MSNTRTGNPKRTATRTTVEDDSAFGESRMARGVSTLSEQDCRQIAGGNRAYYYNKIAFVYKSTSDGIQFD